VGVILRSLIGKVILMDALAERFSLTVLGFMLPSNGWNKSDWNHIRVLAGAVCIKENGKKRMPFRGERGERALKAFLSRVKEGTEDVGDAKLATLLLRRIYEKRVRYDIRVGITTGRELTEEQLREWKKALEGTYPEDWLEPMLQYMRQLHREAYGVVTRSN
jgi:hypothetical protein